MDDAVGEAVRWFREQTGLSQERLGIDSGVGRTYVSEIERGLKNPTMPTLFRLAKVLQVRPSDIVLYAERRVRSSEMFREGRD